MVAIKGVRKTGLGRNSRVIIDGGCKGSKEV